MTGDGAHVHAWVLPHEIDGDRWTVLRYDATRVLRLASARLEEGRPATAAGLLHGPLGMGLPEVGEDRIAFNGNAFRGESADAFVLERRATSGVVARADRVSTGRVVRRCDTRGFPYDLAVCALLLTVRRHLGDAMRLGSSGTLRDGWRAAADVVREATGEGGQLVQGEQGLLGWEPHHAVTHERRVRNSA